LTRRKFEQLRRSRHPTVPLKQHHTHPRTFHENRFVYPVLSRRSRGISIGVNLNPDKICNFDCIYCQVDRTSSAETSFVEIDRLMVELDAMLTLVADGGLFDDPAFIDIPDELRRLNDITDDVPELRRDHRPGGGTEERARSR